MNNKPNTRVILHAFDAPKEQLIRTNYFRFERAMKERFVDYSNISNDLRASIMERIHISSANIFSTMNNLVNHKENTPKVVVTV